MNGIRLLLGCLSLLVLAGPAAGTETPADTVRFQVERHQDVSNDLVVAVLVVEAEDPDAATLASRLNKTMDWALQQLRGNDTLQVSTGNYQTYPVRDKLVFKGWRGSQELHLRSKEPDEVSRVLGKLQEKLQVRSMGFQVSPERRRAVEDELIAEALKAFQSRAELVRENLGAGAYRLGELQIHSGGQRPPVPVMRAQVASFEVAPVAMEGGTSQVTVTVNGSIELVRRR